MLRRCLCLCTLCLIGFATVSDASALQIAGEQPSSAAAATMKKSTEENAAIGNAQRMLYEIIARFRDDDPQFEDKEERMERLQEHLRDVQEKVLVVLYKNDCYQGSTWPSYQIAVKLQMKMFQQGVEEAFWVEDDYHTESGVLSNSAKGCLNNLIDRRQQAITVSFLQTNLESPKGEPGWLVQDTWPGEGFEEYLDGCKGSKEILKSCPAAEQRYNSIVKILVEKFRKQCEDDLEDERCNAWNSRHVRPSDWLRKKANFITPV